MLGLSPNLPYHFLDLVALATIADIVPLTGENRVLVRHGLKLLTESRWPGLRALIQASGLAGKEDPAGQVGFILAPRLNAAGRVGDANDGLRLLLTDDENEANRLALMLERMNVERQGLDQRILEEPSNRSNRRAIPPAILRWSWPRRTGIRASWGSSPPGWWSGMVGGFSHRTRRRHREGKRAQHLAVRSPRGIGTVAPICSSASAGTGWRAGLTLRRDRLEAFRERFSEIARETLSDQDLGPEQRVDLVVDLGDMNPDLERLCRHLEPCGMGNPAPVFGARGDPPR